MAVRWGILGTGFIAGLFVNDLVRNGHSVTAVGSRTEASARRFADEHGIHTAHSSYEALCADPNVDAVYVASLNPFHAEHALLVLRAGKHALVEKPFTMTTNDAERVIAEASERGLLVMEALWTRFLPHMTRLRELVASGAIGQVRALEADLSQAFTLAPQSRFNKVELGGGAMFDLGVYAVSLAVDVMGIPTAVHAVVSPTTTGVDAQASVVLGFRDGGQAMLHVAIDSRGPMTASVLGTKGRIDIRSAWHRASALTVVDNDGDVVEHYEPAVSDRGMQFEAAEFERLISEGLLDSEVMPHAQTVAVLEVVTQVRSLLP